MGQGFADEEFYGYAEVVDEPTQRQAEASIWRYSRAPFRKTSRGNSWPFPRTGTAVFLNANPTSFVKRP